MATCFSSLLACLIRWLILSALLIHQPMCTAEAILHGGSGVEYERARYARALAVAAGGEDSAEAAQAPSVADLLPITHAWLKQVLQEAAPPAGLQETALCRTVVASGILLLVQRPHAIDVHDCPGKCPVGQQFRVCAAVSCLFSGFSGDQHNRVCPLPSPLQRLYCWI